MAITEPVFVVWIVTTGGRSASLETRIFAIFSSHLSYDTSLIVNGVPRIPPNREKEETLLLGQKKKRDSVLVPGEMASLTAARLARVIYH